MSTNLEFWPAELTSDLPESPILIMQKAAAELGVATQGAVEAIVQLDSNTTENEGLIAYDFYINAKALNYRHLLFWVQVNPILLYPVQIHVHGVEYEVSTSEQLTYWVKSVTTSTETVRMIKALLVQSRSL